MAVDVNATMTIAMILDHSDCQFVQATHPQLHSKAIMPSALASSIVPAARPNGLHPSFMKDISLSSW